MALTLPIVWHDDCLLHAPGSEFWLGLQLPDDELPERAALIREALVAEGATVVAATAHDDAPMMAVHEAGLVNFLRAAHADWVEAGLPLDPGQGLVVPYLFPTRAMLGAVEPHRPEAVWARTGFYCFDTMTPIGEGTWAAVRAGVDATLTASTGAADAARGQATPRSAWNDGRQAERGRRGERGRQAEPGQEDKGSEGGR